MPSTQAPWSVYLLRCSDGSIYTGISKNVIERVCKHNEGKGAKYTASRCPVTLIYQEQHPDWTSATKREIEIKRWTKKRKEKLVDSGVGQTSPEIE